MRVNVTAKILFPESNGRPAFYFTKIAEVTIEKSWKRLTDVATIRLPRNVKEFQRTDLTEKIKRGDKVIIQTGYNSQLETEFEGFVTLLEASSPIVIHCEDNMYKLKQEKISIAKQNVKLGDVLKAIVPKEFSIDAADIPIGSLTYRNFTAAQILEQIKNDFGLYSYFSGSTLVCGKIYLDNLKAKVLKYHLEKNVKANNLEVLSKTRPVQVTMKSTKQDGTKIEVKVGEAGGDNYDESTYYIETVAELKQLALKKLESIQATGLKGTFTAYAIPFIQHGNTVEITSFLAPEKKGRFYADSVVTTLSMSDGISREITISNIAS